MSPLPYDEGAVIGGIKEGSFQCRSIMMRIFEVGDTWSVLLSQEALALKGTAFSEIERHGMLIIRSFVVEVV